MNKEELIKINEADENFSDKLGELVFDQVMSDDVTEMGKHILKTLIQCQTEKEFEIANNMLVSVCGWGISSLVDMIKMRDANGHCWESIY